MRFMRETSRSEINVGVQEKLFRFFYLRDKKRSITEPQAFYFGSLCFTAIKRSHSRHPEPTPFAWPCEGSENGKKFIPHPDI